MHILPIDIDQDWTAGTTRYWFDVDGEVYAVSDTAGELTLLDSEGYPIDPANDHARLLDALRPHYEALAPTPNPRSNRYEH